MPCYQPRDGKRWITKGNIKLKEPCLRPCGMCIGCKLEFARQWAMRCYHEAFMYEHNQFVTLTYRCEKSCPYWWDHHNEKDKYIKGTICNHSLKKSHLQKFLKRLRKHYGNNTFRYYACGEYGDYLGRRHYHLLIFNLNIKDKKIIHQAKYRHYKNQFQKSMADHTLYSSKTIKKIWKKGFVTIGDVTLESAGYVARYCLKKITGQKAIRHYNGKLPEFALMSKGQKKGDKGGIGKPFYDKYTSDIYPKDFTTINGIKMQPPRYYDQLLEREKPKTFEQIKEARRQKTKPKYFKEMQREKDYKQLITDQTLIRSIEL